MADKLLKKNWFFFCFVSYKLKKQYFILTFTNIEIINGVDQPMN